MKPNYELGNDDRSTLAAALIWPAIDVSQAEEARPAVPSLGGMVAAMRDTASYATLLETAYEEFPNKAPIADLVQSLRPFAGTQAFRQQLQSTHQPLEDRYQAIADLLDSSLMAEQATAFKELMLAVGEAAARQPDSGPTAGDTLRRIAIVLGQGQADRAARVATSSARADSDVIHATRRRPTGQSQPGKRPTAQRPRRRRQGG